MKMLVEIEGILNENITTLVRTFNNYVYVQYEMITSKTTE